MNNGSIPFEFIWREHLALYQNHLKHKCIESSVCPTQMTKPARDRQFNCKPAAKLQTVRQASEREHPRWSYTRQTNTKNLLSGLLVVCVSVLLPGVTVWGCGVVWTCPRCPAVMAHQTAGLDGCVHAGLCVCVSAPYTWIRNLTILNTQTHTKQASGAQPAVTFSAGKLCTNSVIKC